MNYTDYNDYELFYMIKDNSTYDDSSCLLYGKYGNLVRKIAKEYVSSAKIYGIEFQDIVQTGMIGLMYAIKSFDASKNVLFYTYATLIIRVEIKQLFRNYMANRRISNCNLLSLNEILVDSIDESTFDDCFNKMIDSENYLKVLDFKNDLSFDNSCIFELRLNGFNYREIAELLSIPLKRIDNALNSIRKKMLNLKNDMSN